jgi:hypothetical protein
MRKYAREWVGVGLRERIWQHTHKRDCFRVHSVRSLCVVSYWMKHPDTDAHLALRPHAKVRT